MTRRAYLLVGVLSAAAAGPILMAPIWTLLASSSHIVGDPETIIPAYVNSMILAAGVSTLALLLTLYLVLIRRVITETLIYAIAFLLIPGEMFAKGLDRLLRLTFVDASGPPEILTFILSQVSFIFPFALVGCLLTVVYLGQSRLEAVQEMRSTRVSQGILIVRGCWPQLLLVWLVGFNLALSETARTVILASDLFGLGRQYFGPLVASAFAAGGVSPLLTILSLTPILPIIPLLIVLHHRQPS